MVYEGRSTRTARRKRIQVTGSRNGRTAAKLFICICILLMAALLKIIFPTAMEKAKGSVLEVIGGSVDYTSALRVLGEAANGSKNVFEALREACIYAFTISGNDMRVSSDDLQNQHDVEQDTGQPVLDEPDDSELFDMAAASGPPDGEKDDETEPNGESDPVERFKREQSAYSDMVIPNNVTYEMPELKISCMPPVDGEVTSGFGYREHPADGEVRFHYGADIAAAEGTAVSVFADGVVLAVGDSTSYGIYVIVQHDSETESLYAHLKNTSVTGGETVKAGDKVGEVGSTGNATGNCLHFELLIGGEYVNPEYYLNFGGENEK